MSFRREMHVPRGGPDGGDGGDGGSLILEARHGVNSLAAYANRHFFRGPKGTHGMGAKRHGKNGKDATLLVPLGTSVIDARHGFVIRDLITEGERFVVARGGKGGRGNVHFKSSTNQAPRQRTLGEDGETRAVILELKSIADVGLIGMPNAGKSTLLSRISSARPEIADYPFTTKHPNIGIVDVTDEKAFVVADIPGLIEGASEGVGLGHEFLRHVERAGLLVHLVEPEPVDRSDAVANYQAIRHELGEYDASLGEREEIVVVTKCEFDSAIQVRDRLAEATGGEVLMISSRNGTGLPALKQAILERVESRRREIAGTPAPDANRRGVPAGDGEEKTNRRRVPPHLAGATAELSNDLQPHDVADPNYNKPSGGRDVDLSACRAEIPAEPHGTSAGISPGQTPPRPSEAEPSDPSSPGPRSSQPQSSAADRERENPS